MTASKLKELYNYNPETGLFTRLKSSGGHKKGTLAGSYDKDGYLRIQIQGKHYKSHRLAWLYMTGEFPKNTIDHINRVRDDNRWENLRDVTILENSKNCGISKRNTSGVVGVRWNKKQCRWIANIRVDGKQIYLGGFTEFSQAVNARKNAEILYGFIGNDNEEVSNG